MKKMLTIILCISLLLLSFPINASAVGTAYDINVSAGDGGRIALTEDGPPENGDISVDEGNDITLYIIPESHYSIDDVMVDGFSMGAISQYTFNDVTSAHSISASFVRNTRTITVAAIENGEILINGSGENGTTLTVDEGSEAEIAIRPGPGYEIDSVTIGAMTYSLDGEIGDRTSEFRRTITVNNNISVSAVFRVAPHIVTTNVGPNGTISPMNPQVSHGGDVTFTITPNPGYSIRSLSVDGNPESVDEHNQITLYNVQNDRTLSVDFAEDITYTITTVAGANGSVTPENPEVAAGSDVTFTITPEPGYIIDELRVDGRPEMADESGEFTVFNVQRDMTLEVSFMQPVSHIITIPKPVNGNIQIVGEDGYIPAGGITLTSNTRDVVSFFIFPDDGYHTPANYPGGYKLSRVYMVDETGTEIEGMIDIYYDETAGRIRADIETQSDYTLRFDFVIRMPGGYDFYYEDIVVLNSEIDTLEALKNAIRREYGLRGIYLWADDVLAYGMPTFYEMTSENGIDFKYGIAPVRDPRHSTGVIYILVYVVENVTNIVFGTGPDTAYITNASDPFSSNAMFEMQGFTSMNTSIHGVYDPMFMPLSEEASSAFNIHTFVPGNPMWGYYWLKPFYAAQFHVVNRAREPENQLNLFPFTIIQENALCMRVEATSESGTQETFPWELNTYPHVTLGDSTHEVFFGNDRVILEKPAGGIGDIASMRAAASNSPGYTFTNNNDGTITIDFMSDYYDKVSVPLTITKQSGGTVQRNLIIHRVGVDIQAHDAQDGNPSSTRTVFHGTQYGNLVDFADGNKYKITVSYYIPDYGGDRPYGLYVTRKYANGRIETQVITQPMTNPHPGQADWFDPDKMIYMYNDGSSGWANAADYLIYAGPNAASAPVEVSVLVLKNAPTNGGLFGGVDYGSGTGVKWTKP